MTDIYDVREDGVAAALLSGIAEVARSVRALLGPDGINIWQSTGEAAGQEVFHLHFHVVPRYEGDGLIQFFPSKPAHPDRAEMDALAAKLRGG
jgi:histidine triad (HIT) family protein